MNNILQNRLNQLINLQNFSCWYLVKHPTTIYKLCYLVSFLEKYQKEHCTEQFQKYISDNIAKLNEQKGLEISDNYRTLLVAAYFGLIQKIAAKGSTYEQSKITDTYYEIKERCNGDFEKTELYNDIIERQIEKIYLSTAIDDKYEGIRANYKLYPVMFLYKILVEIGRTTGDYSITLNEYEYLVETTENYEDYLKTLFYITLYREEPNIDSIFVAELGSKFDNRFKQAIKQLPTLVFENGRIYLKKSYLDIITKKLFYFEKKEKKANLETYFDFLGSTKSLIDFDEVDDNIKDIRPLSELKNKKSTKEKICKPHNRIIFGAPGTGKSYQLNQDAKVFGNNYERVTFHPNYSYAQFVGTYKPIAKTKSNNMLGGYEKEVITILSDENISSTEKFNKLYQTGINISALCALIGLSTGDTDFSTIRTDGSISEKDHTLMSGVGKNMIPFATLKLLHEETEITYSYVPGPFIRVLEKALYSQQIGENQPYLLIIEEINRAVVSAVFGDIFQLLDRNENGESQYEIDVSEDLYNYLTSEDNEQTGHKKLNIGKKLKLPNNMYIWATMNSADQGVQPMDAAFKRRWDFEYLPLNENEKEIEKYQLPFPKEESFSLESWKEVRAKINGLLKKVGNINEDKLLGPFFISESNLKKYDQVSDTEIAKDFSKLFKSKVLMYLYEDVCKINPKQIFTNVKSKSGIGKIHFSDVCDAFDEIGIGVFGG